MKKHALFIALLTVAIDLLGFGIVVPLLPRYGKRLADEIPPEFLGLTIGLLMSSFSAVQFLFAPFWGRWSDRIGRRPILLLGLAGSVVFFILFAYATTVGSLVLLFVARIGQGFAGATIATAQAVIADCTPPERRAKGMALVGMAFGIGFTLGPIIGSLWASTDLNAPPSPGPGWAAAGLSLVAWILAFFLLPETRTANAEQRARPWWALTGWRYAWTLPDVFAAVSTYFISILAFAMYEGTFARVTQDAMGLSDRDNFYMFCYIGLTLTVTQGLLVRQLTGRVPEVTLIFAGLIVLATGMIGTAWAGTLTSLPLLLLATLFTVVGFSFITPATQGLISRAIDVNHQGEMFGVTQSIGSIARIIGPVMGNVLYGGQGHINVRLPFEVSFGLLIVGLMLTARLRRTNPSRTADDVAPPSAPAAKG